MKFRPILTLLGTAAILIAGVATVHLASAHSRPIRFDPPAGAILTEGPASVSGWFTSDLRNDPNWNYLRVTDEDGNRVDTDQINLSSDRRQMSVPLQSGLEPGRYQVTWRTWDDEDGEIFGDCYVFYIGQEAADQAVADKFRLDAGSSCERIEFDAREGTPVPGATMTPGGGVVPGGSTSGSSSSDSDGGIPLWGLIAGVGAGAAVGLVGGRLLGGGRP